MDGYRVRESWIIYGWMQLMDAAQDAADACSCLTVFEGEKDPCPDSGFQTMNHDPSTLNIQPQN